MNNTWRLAGHLVLPALGALLATLWIVGAATFIDEDRPVEWIPFALLGVAIGLSRVEPFSALVLAGAALTLPFMLDSFPPDVRTSTVALGVLVVIAVAAGSQRSWSRWAAIMLAVGLAFAFQQAFRANLEATLAIFAVAMGVWGIGFGLRAGLDQVAEARRLRTLEAEVAASEAELALSVERDRIAQDVHDIMAHSLSVIVAQADGARFVRAKQPDAVDGSLEAIADAARESLAEVRLLIQGLSDTSEGHSHPSIAEIPDLLERMRSAGLAIESGSHGEPTGLTLGQELALYRIVQEALTNALTHGGRGTAVRIGWDWRGPGLALVIASRGMPERAPVATARAMRGLTGMAERARLAGGWLVAEVDAEDPDRFVVTAFVPTTAALLTGQAEAAR